MRTRHIAAVTILTLPFALGGYGRFGTAHAQPLPAAPAAIHTALHAVGLDDDDRDRDARQQGHDAGMQAAYDDMRDGRSPDPERHREFRHPPVSHHLRDAYRNGFRDGYDQGVRNGGDRMRDYNGNRNRHDDDDNRPR